MAFGKSGKIGGKGKQQKGELASWSFVDVAEDSKKAGAGQK